MMALNSLDGNFKKMVFQSKKQLKKIKKILKTKIKLIGSGRTDRGVHAKAQFANFKIEKKIESKIKFLNSANFFLKKNI